MILTRDIRGLNIYIYASVCFAEESYLNVKEKKQYIKRWIIYHTFFLKRIYTIQPVIYIYVFFYIFCFLFIFLCFLQGAWVANTFSCPQTEFPQKKFYILSNGLSRDPQGYRPLLYKTEDHLPSYTTKQTQQYQSEFELGSLIPHSKSIIVTRTSVSFMAISNSTTWKLNWRHFINFPFMSMNIIIFRFK